MMRPYKLRNVHRLPHWTSSEDRNANLTVIRATPCGDFCPNLQSVSLGIRSVILACAHCVRTIRGLGECTPMMNAMYHRIT